MLPIYAAEGWFVSHLFYRIDRKELSSVNSKKLTKRHQKFLRLTERFTKAENCQLFCYSVWGTKADLAIMLIDPEFGRIVQTETEILTAFPAGVFERVDSYCSMSEISEYMSQQQDYDRTLKNKENLTPDSAEYKAKMEAFQERMRVYVEERLYPQIPDHKTACVYPMSKKRGDSENWYLLDFEARKRYMASHAITGRKFQGKVKQLVTGAIGLDDWEWVVSLFSDDPYYFKKILYEMRYDEASARFGEFGHFYVGIRIEPEDLFEQLRI
jgi:chlorite dismutase